MKKKKFNQIWSNQTSLGEKFGITSIQVGKILTNFELKSGKLATKKAISEGFAKETPLKNGTSFFMWNLEKVEPLLSKQHQKLSSVDYYASKVISYIKSANKILDGGQDKLGYLMLDTTYDEVPKNIREEVKKRVKEIAPSDLHHY